MKKKVFSALLVLVGVILIASFAAFASTNTSPPMLTTGQQITGMVQEETAIALTSSATADQSFAANTGIEKAGPAIASEKKTKKDEGKTAIVSKKSHVIMANGITTIYCKTLSLASGAAPPENTVAAGLIPILRL